MMYRSTAPGSTQQVTLHEALSKCLPPDGGMYVPCSLPVIPKAFFNNIAEMSLRDVGYIVANQLYGSDMPSAQLKRVVAEALDFDTPLRTVDPGIHVLELWHGPSGSYKDFGTRFMSRLMKQFAPDMSGTTVLTATTGDAGVAVSEAFRNMPGVTVIVLYPKGHTATAQLKQIIRMGGNIIPVEVRASFADCMALVKQSLLDRDLSASYGLTSANSLNLNRLLPQTIYYFYAYANMSASGLGGVEPVISVPTGNLGNLTAGLLAKRMGLPVSRFIVSTTNLDDPLVRYLDTGQLPQPGDRQSLPPNLLRILDMYDGNVEALRRDVEARVFAPEEITGAYVPGGYQADATATAAYVALHESLHPGEQGIFLATTSPHKESEYLRTLERPRSIPPQTMALNRILAETCRKHR